MAQALHCRTRAQRRAWPTSLPEEQRAPIPALHTTPATFHASDSTNRTHNGGTSKITFSICRCSGTRGRDPQCAWYHRNFLFSQCPILARHSSGPFGGIFEIRSRYTFITFTESQSLKSVCFHSLRLRCKVSTSPDNCTFANVHVVRSKLASFPGLPTVQSLIDRLLYDCSILQAVSTLQILDDGNAWERD